MSDSIKELQPTERPVMERHLIALRESLKEYIDLKFTNLEKRIEDRFDEMNSTRGV